MTTKQAWAVAELAKIERRRKALPKPSNWRERRRRDRQEDRICARMGRLIRIANPEPLDDLPF